MKHLGIELGSTRVKAVLVDDALETIAAGSHGWENRFENGVWTYHADEFVPALRHAYAELKADYAAKTGETLSEIDSIGISGMMHGYLPFDAAGRQLAPFRTWRNTITGEAAGILSEAFRFNVPERWSVAHWAQAILNGEAHVPQVARLNTLAGHVHFLLTGRFALGVDEASGMFPINPATKTYDAAMLARFDAWAAERGVSRPLADLLPAVCVAGEEAGALTAEGARLLDPAGDLRPGAVACPPEGDAGTGMVATRCLKPGTGNVSAGTSIFAMIVLEKPLSGWYPEIDVVATPAGDPVAMVHCNNGSSDLDSWMRLFAEVGETLGAEFTTGDLYDRLFSSALKASPDCGGVKVCNFVSDEPLARAKAGPGVSRAPDSALTLPNFMRASLTAICATLKIGMDLLKDREGVSVRELAGHGGVFKTPGVMERVMGETLGVPVKTLSTAGEGGAWGVAALAAYRRFRAAGGVATLDAFLSAPASLH
ncbi:MAG: ATPase [Kiritimatiellae bacterium]|nr:ATPase [Kiritimatiellia bacterium]